MRLSVASQRAIQYRLFELEQKNIENARSIAPSEAYAAKIVAERLDLERDLEVSLLVSMRSEE